MLAPLVPLLFAGATLLSTPAPAAAQIVRSRIAVERQIEFHSSALVNLHHVLHALAAERRAGAPRRINPGALDGSMSLEDRQVWDAAIDYYGRELAARDLRTGEGMTGIKQALAREDLRGVAPRLREVLEPALPVYRRHFWLAHDRDNRAWTADLLSRYREVAPALVPRLQRLLGAWPAVPARVDVVWVAKPAPYTTLEPLHVVMGSTYPDAQEWHAVEMLLHELAHAASGPLERELADAFAQRNGDPGDLWHAAIFYVTGEALRQALAEKGIQYEPYLYRTGLFDRAWAAARPALEKNLRDYVDGEAVLSQAASRISAAVLAPPGAADAAVGDMASLRFYSSFWMNLHHTLFAAAWARRPGAGTLTALAGRLPVPLDAPLSAQERAAWDGAVAYYDREVASRDLLFGRGMEALKMAIVSGNLGSDAVGADLRAALEAAAPVYRKHYWPGQDGANVAWIEAAIARLRAIAPEVIPQLETLYRVTWFSSPVRVDVVWVGNRQGAYTTIGPPPHITISSGQQETSPWTAPEIVFHEASHLLVQPVRDALTRALGDRVNDHGQLWHVVQFYITGAVVQQVLRRRGVEYEPYLYSTGLFDRAWSRYRKVVEESWKPYVEGQSTLEQAIARTIQGV